MSNRLPAMGLIAARNSGGSSSKLGLFRKLGSCARSPIPSTATWGKASARTSLILPLISSSCEIAIRTSGLRSSASLMASGRVIGCARPAPSRTTDPGAGWIPR